MTRSMTRRKVTCQIAKKLTVKGCDLSKSEQPSEILIYPKNTIDGDKNNWRHCVTVARV